MVELRIGNLGRETARSLVQLRMLKHCRLLETAARRKGESREGNNPDYS